MTDDADMPPGPPLVTRVEEELPPLVLPAAPAPRRRPRPGLGEASLLTVLYLVVLYGPIIAIVGAAVGYLLATAGPGALAPPPGAPAATLPDALVAVTALALPVGYAAGLLYTVVMFRRLAGRGWAREAGLHRLPPTHLGLCLLALPAFVVASDLIAAALYQAFGMADLQEAAGKTLQDLTRPFHWSFAVLAVGVAPGVAEELWCRGFLGRGLVGRYGVVAGVVLTSMFFGLLHAYPPPYVVVTGLMGAALHYTYVVSRSLWVPIILHALNNSVAALMTAGVVPAGGLERALTEDIALSSCLAAGTLLSAGLALWTARDRLVAADGSPVAGFRGVMVPPPASGVVVVRGRPSPLYAAAAAGCSAALVWVLLR